YVDILTDPRSVSTLLQSHTVRATENERSNFILFTSARRNSNRADGKCITGIRECPKFLKVSGFTIHRLDADLTADHRQHDMEIFAGLQRFGELTNRIHAPEALRRAISDQVAAQHIRIISI